MALLVPETHELDTELFNRLVRKYSDYIELSDAIYRLKSDDIEPIFQDIVKVSKKYNISINIFIKMLNNAIYDNFKYLRGYWKLLQRIIDTYQPTINIQDFNKRFLVLMNLHYNLGYHIVLTSEDDFEASGKTEEQILQLHEPGTILHAVLNDDVVTFRNLYLQRKFNNKFDLRKMALIDWCVNYGAINCFHFLIMNGGEFTQTTFERVICSRNPTLIAEFMRLGFKMNPYYADIASCCHVNDVMTKYYKETKFRLRLPGNDQSHNLYLFLLEMCAFKDYSQLFSGVCFFGIKELCDDLLQLGAYVNGRQRETACSCLHYCISQNDVELTKYFVQLGADVNVINTKKFTPLHLAAELDRAEIAEILLDHGADPNIKSPRGKTAIEIAKENRSERTQEMLRHFQRKRRDLRIQ